MRAMGVEPGQKGLRDRNSPMCTLTQNGYGAILFSRKTDPALTLVFLVAHQKCRLGSKPRDISNSHPIGMKRVKKMTALGVEPGQKGLRDRNSPMCTLSQNGYGAILSSRKTDPALTLVFLFAHQSLLPNAPPPTQSPPATKLLQTVRSSWGNAPARSGPDLPAPAPN